MERPRLGHEGHPEPHRAPLWCSSTRGSTSGHAPHPDGDWQAAIARYLVERLDMQAPEIFEVLCKCEHDEVTRARYTKLAREAMPWWQG
jgi:hypothetical protein